MESNYKIIKKYYKQRGDSKVCSYFIVLYKESGITGDRWKEVKELKSTISGGTFKEVREFYSIEEARNFVKNIAEELPPDEEIEI